MSSSSNSNRQRSIAASSGLFRCVVMNSGEFRADSGKLRGGVFAPTRFDRYTTPLDSAFQPPKIRVSGVHLR